MSIDKRVTLPVFASHLVFIRRPICWLDIPFDQVLNLTRSCCWSLPFSYLTIYKFSDSARRLSSALTVAIWRWNRPPNFCSGVKFALNSVNMCTLRITGTMRQMERKCTTRHYMTSKLVCGVLWVQLEILSSFFQGPYIHNHVNQTFEDRKTFCAFLISNVLRFLNVVCFPVVNSPAFEFYMQSFRNASSVPSS